MTTERGPRSGSVLIVEDNPDIRALVSTILTTGGYAVREASSGEEAIEIAKREPVRLVLLDIRLPGLSGYEVCGWLRSRLGDNIPIIFLSGERIEAFDRAAGLMLGADDYLVKPFSNEELLARVRGLLRRSVTVPRQVAAKLTLRELEVLRLLAGGLDQIDISDQLQITPRTVGTHIEHILMKLGVQSRTQAVALAYREHLLEPDAEPERPPQAPRPANAFAHELSVPRLNATAAAKPAR